MWFLCLYTVVYNTFGVYMQFCSDVNLKKCLTVQQIEEKQDNSHQVNLLSVILNDAPILPEEDDEDVALLVKDSPQCMTFGLFMIW